MKILAINGSPNKNGSTASLIDLILNRCKKENMNVDRINLEDFTIVCDTDCEVCLKQNKCDLTEDFFQLKAKMMEADAVIIGSPYYDGFPEEHIQDFIRKLFYAAFIKKDFKNKYIIGVSTSAVSNCKDVAKFCANLGFNSWFGGFNVSGIIYDAVMGDEGIKEVKSDDYISGKVNEMVLSLKKQLSDSERVKKDRKIFLPNWLTVLIYKIIWKNIFIIRSKFLKSNSIMEY